MIVDAALVERVQDLKQEYGIGSAPALAYLKECDIVEAYLSELKKEIHTIDKSDDFLTFDFVNEAYEFFKEVTWGEPESPSNALIFLKEYSTAFNCFNINDLVVRKAIVFEKVCRKILKKEVDAEDLLGSIRNGSYKKTMREVYLHGTDLIDPNDFSEVYLSRYARAVLERTLHRTLTQRQIALDYLHFETDRTNFSAVKKVSDSEKELRSILAYASLESRDESDEKSARKKDEPSSKSNERFQARLFGILPSFSLYHEIVDRNTSSADVIYPLIHGTANIRQRNEYLAGRTKYILSAIAENRNWLLKMLG